MQDPYASVMLRQTCRALKAATPASGKTCMIRDFMRERRIWLLQQNFEDGCTHRNGYFPLNIGWGGPKGELRQQIERSSDTRWHMREFLTRLEINF